MLCRMGSRTLPLRRPAILASQPGARSSPVYLARSRIRCPVPTTRAAPSPPALLAALSAPLSSPLFQYPRAAPVTDGPPQPRPQLPDRRGGRRRRGGLAGPSSTRALSDPSATRTAHASTAQALFVRAAARSTPGAPRSALDRPHPRSALLLPLAQVADPRLARSGGTASPFRAAYAAFFPIFLLRRHDGARRCARRRTARRRARRRLVPSGLLAERGRGTAYSECPPSPASPAPRCCSCCARRCTLARDRRRPAARRRRLDKQEGAPLALWALAVSALPLCRRGRVGTLSTGTQRSGASRLSPRGLILAAALTLRAPASATIPQRSTRTRPASSRCPRPLPTDSRPPAPC